MITIACEPNAAVNILNLQEATGSGMCDSADYVKRLGVRLSLKGFGSVREGVRSSTSPSLRARGQRARNKATLTLYSLSCQSCLQFRGQLRFCIRDCGRNSGVQKPTPTLPKPQTSPARCRGGSQLWPSPEGSRPASKTLHARTQRHTQHAGHTQLSAL